MFYVLKLTLISSEFNGFFAVIVVVIALISACNKTRSFSYHLALLSDMNIL